VPEAGAQHAWQALEAGKHVVMVNVEADALLGPVLGAQGEQAGLVYSMAYGDQPALVAEQIDWARAVGLEVVCAGKGTRYQPEYHYSTPETVWAITASRRARGLRRLQRQDVQLLSRRTKSAIEMCAVANGNGLTPQRCGCSSRPWGWMTCLASLNPVRRAGSSSTTARSSGGEPRTGTARRWTGISAGGYTWCSARPRTT